MGGEPNQSPALGELDARICPTCQRPLGTWQDECPVCREPATLRLSVSTEALPPVPAHLRDVLEDEGVGPGGETEALSAADVPQHRTNEPGAHKPPVVPFDEDVSVPFPTVVGHFVPGGLAGGGAGGGGAGCGDGGC